MPKKILLIAYDFPPRRTSGVYRPVAFVRYLLEHGWQPTVLTITDKRPDVRDPGLLEKVPPEVRIVRTPYVRMDGWEDLAMRLTRGRHRHDDGPESPVWAGAGPSVRQSRLRRWSKGLARLLRGFLYFPDEFVGWLPWGLAAGIKLCMRERFDVVYTTSPPRSTPLIGYFLKLFLGVTWLNELQDPWLLPAGMDGVDIGSGNALVGKGRHVLAARVDAGLVRRADLVVTMTRGYAQQLQSQHRLPPSKIACISNGFDEDDFLSPMTEHDGLLEPGFVHLSHIGTIYSRGSGNFFPALADLVRENPEVTSKLRINIIGYPDGEVVEYARQEHFRDMIRVHGFIQHDEALRIMAASHCLLILYDNVFFSRFCVPGKLYEYLRAGRPVLALTHPGEVQELVEGSGAGWVIRPDDTSGIKEVVQTLLRSGASGQPLASPNPHYVAGFSYERLTSELVAALEGLSGRRG